MMFDLKISEVTVTYISWSSDFALSWRLFDVWTSYFVIMSQYDTTFDLQTNVGHCDLYFIVQWFLPYILPYILYVLGHCLFWDTLDFCQNNYFSGL